MDSKSPAADATSASTSAPPLSKNARKRALKAERHAIQKLERRTREKEAKKQKKRALAAKRDAGEVDVDGEEERSRKRQRVGAAGGKRFGGRVVLDLGFDDMMTDKEIISLCSQLAYTYSANRRASYPFSLLYTSLNGRTFTRLEGMNDAGYKRWANTEWWHDGYERLWMGPGGDGNAGGVEVGGKEGETELVKGRSGERTDCIETGTGEIKEAGISEPMEDVKATVVYLTADSDEELMELKETETYIIGGICDHNRYKNLCENKSKTSAIRSARLPISRYLASLPTRKVLTVNQVFEILLHWVETRDWEEAFHAVIPKRKFVVGGKGGGAKERKVSEEMDDGEVVEAGTVVDEGGSSSNHHISMIV